MNLTLQPGDRSTAHDLAPIDPTPNDLGARIRQWAEAPYAWAFFFLTAAIVFSSFFLEGKVLLASSDHTFGHYPNILFGHRMLRQGDFGLWNPLIFGGVDFTSSFHHHMLHPLNWPLLLLPEQFVLHGVSVQCYLELALIGIFAFRIIRRIENDSLIALFVALVAQLGGFAWFTATTLIGTHLLFAAAAAIYVIVSHTSRRPVLNYIYLALCFIDILMMGHIAYISAFGLPVVVVFFWWTWPQSIVRPWQGLMPAVALAFVTACCLSAVRILPVMHGLMYEQSVVETLRISPGSKDQGYFALTGFVPEIFGLHLADSFAYDSGTRPNAGMQLGRRHTQFHNLLYYGIAPILLIWLSVLRGLGSRSFGLAATFLVVVVAPLYLLQPLSDLVNIAVFPIYHEIMFRTGGMFLLCAALVPILREVRDAGIEPDDWRLRWFLALVGIILASCMAMLVRASETKTHLAGNHFVAALIAVKVLILAGLPACFFAVGRLKLNIVSMARLTRGATILFWLGMIVLAAIALWRGYFWHTWLTYRGFAYTVASGLWAVFAIWLARTLVLERTLTRWQWRLLVGSGVAAMLICLVPINEYHGERRNSVLLFSGALSMVKFVLLASVALEMVVLCGAVPARRRQLLPLLILLTFGELVGHTKLYGHVGTHPFINAAALYPRRQHWDRARADWLASANAPDILSNARLQSADAIIPGWTTGGTQAASQPTDSGVKIAARAADGATLFQDVVLPEPVDALTLGAWVRSSSDVPVKLILSAGNRRGKTFGAESAPYAGRSTRPLLASSRRVRNLGAESAPYGRKKDWEWLTVTVLHEGIDHGRPHVAIAGIGEVEISGISLVRGVASRVTPRPAGDVYETPSLTRAEAGPFNFDTKNYRVNRPTQVLRYQESEVLSNINMVYGVSTYSGVDSDVKKNLLTLINAFDDNPAGWKLRMGIFGTLTNPRLLDILGVKYDWDGQDVVNRPDALARFSVFENFEVCTDREEMLERLNEPDFDPAQSIVLDSQPPQPTGSAARFQPVDFEAHGTSRLTTQIDLKRPSILLFNDSHSKYWGCTCNGKSVPVMIANGNFMAVALPAGPCQVEWAFRPVPVLRLFWLSVATSCILAGVAVWAAFSRKRKCANEHALPDLKMAA